jgi:hypothetical protein
VSRSARLDVAAEPDIAATWSAVTGCLVQLLSLRGLTGQAGLSDGPLWLLAVRLHAAAGHAPAYPSAASLRYLDQVFWSHGDTLSALLADAIGLVATAERSAGERCAGLGQAIGALREVTPRSAPARAELGRALDHAAASAAESGRLSICALRQRSLGPSPPGSWRGRIARWLRRDDSRYYRDVGVARDTAARLASHAVPALAAHTRALTGAASDALARLGRVTADCHADRTAWRERAGLLCPELAPVPGLLSGPADPRTWSPEVAAVLGQGARAGIRGLGPGDTWWRRAIRANSGRRDLISVSRRRGFVADRAVIVPRCAEAWQHAITYWRWTAADQTGAAGGYLQLLAALDDTSRRWLDTLDRNAAAARRARRDLSVLGTGLDTAAELLSAARRSWTDLHRPGPGGLSAGTRACLAALSRVAECADAPGALRADLARLSHGRAELRLPVVAPMKAGKSTLLCALLGADIVPHRAHVMTALATRFIPVSPAACPEAELILTAGLVAGHARLLDALGRVADSRIASLGGRPHLQELAVALRDGHRVELRPWQTGTSVIRDLLTWLHDTVRLATIVLPSAAAEQVADWVPEVHVPVPGTLAGGRLVLIDTPGTGEAAASPVLASIVARQLAEAHGCLVLVDYTQLGGMAAAQLAQLVTSRAAAAEPAAVVVAVNRIDQRRDGDPEAAAVRDVVRHILDIPAWKDVPVIETAAALGMAAWRYLDQQDAATQAEFLQLVYPLGPPDPLPPPDKLRQRAVTAARRSGITELRAEIHGRIHQHLPDLAVRNALARADALGAGVTADLVADARWAARLAASAAGRGR